MEKEYLIGINLRREINAGLIDLNGKITKKLTLPIDESASKIELINNISFLINKLKKDRIIGVGIGIPGPVDFKNGIALNPPISSLKNIQLKKILEDKTKIPVYVDNGANCFTIASHKIEFEKKFSNILGVVVDKEIDGGIVINNKIYRGCFGAAGNIGHMSISHNGLRCSVCGNHDCLNLYSSATAIEKRVFSITNKHIPFDKIGEISKKNKRIRKVNEEAAMHLGFALANVAKILNPDLIVLNGCVSTLGGFVDLVNNSLKKAGENIKVVRSELEDAEILGAASIIF